MSSRYSEIVGGGQGDQQHRGSPKDEKSLVVHTALAQQV